MRELRTIPFKTVKEAPKMKLWVKPQQLMGLRTSNATSKESITKSLLLLTSLGISGSFAMTFNFKVL